MSKTNFENFVSQKYPKILWWWVGKPNLVKVFYPGLPLDLCLVLVLDLGQAFQLFLIVPEWALVIERKHVPCKWFNFGDILVIGVFFLQGENKVNSTLFHVWSEFLKVGILGSRDLGSRTLSLKSSDIFG